MAFNHVLSLSFSKCSWGLYYTALLKYKKIACLTSLVSFMGFSKGHSIEFYPCWINEL